MAGLVFAAALLVAPHAGLAKSGPAPEVVQDIKAGRAAFDAGDLKTALDDLLHAAQLDPSNQDAIYWLGRIYLQQGVAQSAFDQFSILINLNPRSDRAYYGRAKAEMKLGQYAGAVDDFNRFAGLNKAAQNEVFYASRGDAYLDNGQNDLAIQDYSQALVLRESLKPVYIHRGVAYARIKSYSLALADLNMAEQLGRAANVGDFATYYYRGLIELVSGDKVGATRDFKTAQAYSDDRKDNARCLAGGGGLFHLGGCVDPAKELNKPAA